MKSKLFLSVVIALFVITKNASASVASTASPYYVDDSKVEELFTNSVETDFTTPDITTPGNPLMSTMGSSFSTTSVKSASDKSVAVALVLDFFLGGLGIHRIYLGTKTFTWVGYILTCGGIFGIMPLIDFIVLAIHSSDISPYVDNSKFFMWSGQ